MMRGGRTFRREIEIPNDPVPAYERIRVIEDEEEMIEIEKAAYEHYVSLPKYEAGEETHRRWWPRFFAAWDAGYFDV